MIKNVLIGALLIICFGLILSEAQANETKLKPGMKFSQGVVCTIPHVVKDLIEVIDNEEMYRGYFHGYSESGYCFEWNGGDLELHTATTLTNTSFDGYRAEMWIVMVEADEGLFVPMYAIIFPDAGKTVSGVGT